MDAALIITGICKLLFGLLVGTIGISLSTRFVARASGLGTLDDAIKERNSAMGIVLGASLVAVALLVGHAVRTTFTAVDLTLAKGESALLAWLQVLGYGLGHVLCALLVSALVLLLGLRSFVKLTPDIDEVQEIHDGNLTSGLVLGSVIIVLAILAQQGMQTLLDGLLPLPQLARDLLPNPS